MKISPRDRLIFTIAGAALLVIALIALLLYPQFRQLSALNAQVVEAQAQADAAKLQLDERRGFKDRAIETNAKWLRLMNQVPDTPDLPSLIIELQDVAFASGVQLVAVTAGATSCRWTPTRRFRSPSRSWAAGPTRSTTCSRCPS